MERLIDPLIADMQCEYEAAIRAGRPWRARRARATGHIAFWKVVAIHLPVWTTRSVRGWAAADDWALGRTIGYGAIAMAVMTALLVAPPMQPIRMHHTYKDPLLFLLLLPQAIPFSLPVGLLVGVLCGLRGRSATARVRHAVVVAGLVGSMAMLGTIGWLVPEANQAFRVAVAGRHIPRGVAEMPAVTLRQMALDLKAHGQPADAGSLMFSYHARWALAGGTLGFALFGLGVSVCRLGRMSTVVLGFGAPAAYYVWELRVVSSSILSEEGAAIALAWFPTVMLILVSFALLSCRRDDLTVS